MYPGQFTQALKQIKLREMKEVTAELLNEKRGEKRHVKDYININNIYNSIIIIII